MTEIDTDLNLRLRRIEQRLRWGQYLLTGTFIFALALGVFVGLTHRRAGYEVRAQVFALVSPNGTEVGRLSSTADFAYLDLGNGRATLTGGKHGAHLSLVGSEGHIQAILAVQEGMPALGLHERSGRPRVELFVGQSDNATKLLLFGGKEGVRAELIAPESGVADLRLLGNGSRSSSGPR